MILTCPECATSYFVDDSRVGAAGRVVKCSNCGARWTAMPDGAAAAPAPAPKAPPPPVPPPSTPIVDEIVFEAPPAPEPTPAKAARKAAPPKKKAAGSPVVVWVGAAIAAAALIAGAIVFRAQIVQAVPASAAAYAGLGMPVSALVIEKVHADAAFQGGHPVLQVTGEVHNKSAETANVPPLKISLLDWTGKPVMVKVAQPVNAPAPGKAIRYFAVTLVDPPLSVHDLEVTFEVEGKGAPPAVKAPVPTPPAK